MGAIALTVVSINGNVVAPTIYGFDIDEISQPISNDGTYSLVTVRTYSRLSPISSFIETRYEVQEGLSDIVSMSDQLFLGDVIFYRGTGADYAVSYQRVFPIDNVRTIFNPDISGTQFNFYENENLLPVFYEVSQTILQIISQLSPTGTFWALNGNTVGAIKTLGTIDNYDLPIITNNVEVARFDTNGDLGIGTNPSYRLDVDSAGTILTAIMRLTNNTNSFKIFTSNASPETVITGDRGDICVVNNGVNGELYIKQTGTATNTGWVSLFINITAGTGISISGTYPNITITNTAPDQIVSLTAGTGISVSGTYPSFTISNTATSGGLKSGIATAAVTDVYTTTIAGVTSYTLNDAYIIKFNTENSNGATININGLGAVQLTKNNDVILTGGDISIGQEFIIIYDGTNFQMLGIAPNQMFAYVTNADSVTITKGQPVYAFGASGDRMSVKLANNTSDATSATTIGLVFSGSIAPNGLGFIITQGVLQNINTAAYTSGDILYVGASAGALTNVKPYAPNHLVYIGVVERANAGNGQIYVKPQNGYELTEIHDVDLITTTPVNNNVLTYVSGPPNLWKPRSISTILGYTPIQSVSGISPISSSGGTTPAISIQDAEADNTTKGACTFDSADFNATAGLVRIDYVSAQAASSTNKGFLTSSDWTTFNNKQASLGYTPLNPSNNLSDLSNVVTARTNLNIVDKYLTAGNQTTTSNAASSITALVHSASASKRYIIDGIIHIGCNGTGGVKFQVTAPAGTTLYLGFAGYTSGTAVTVGTINALSTLTAQAFNTANGQLGYVYIKGEVQINATAGNIQFGFASGTNTQTSTIYQLGTYITFKEL